MRRRRVLGGLLVLASTSCATATGDPAHSDAALALDGPLFDAVGCAASVETECGDGMENRGKARHRLFIGMLEEIGGKRRAGAWPWLSSNSGKSISCETQRVMRDNVATNLNW